MNNNPTNKQQNRRMPNTELLIILILGSMVYLIAIFTDTHQTVDQWADNKRFLGLELIELLVAIVFFAIAFGIFGIRRWREANYEITGRKLSEKMLLESENKFRSLAEKSLAGIYLIQDENFKYVNPMLSEIFGYTVEELIGKKGPIDLVLPEDWPIVKENLRKRLSRESEAIHYNFRGIKKNGEEKNF